MAAKKPKTIGDILATAENPAYVRVSTARILLRQDLHDRHRKLEAELAAAMERDRQHSGDRPISDIAEAPPLAEKLVAFQDETADQWVEFRFRSIGHRAWADLLAAHPPTRDQSRAAPLVDFNPDTFPVAAIAASCVEPEMTVDEAQRLDRALNQTQFDTLWTAVLDANMGGGSDPKSVLAAGLTARRNGHSGAPHTTTGSLAASSSAG